MRAVAVLERPDRNGGRSCAGSRSLHYLKAIRAVGTAEAKAVMAKMKEMPINDFMMMRVKTPEESIALDTAAPLDESLHARSDPAARREQ